jgi:hypothetical protein
MTEFLNFSHFRSLQTLVTCLNKLAGFRNFDLDADNSLPKSKPMNRSIIHLNVADFAVAVERAVDHRLNERPVIIAPEGAARAAVYDMTPSGPL